MNDEQLLRYSRQIMLPQIDVTGQQKLAEAHILIVGIGGLGSPSAMYLAAAGVGRLTLVDHDKVEISNLQRQLAHHESDLGRNKTESAKNNLAGINSTTVIHTFNRKPDNDELTQLVQNADVVIDATDNFETRFSINRCCVRQKKPLVSGAAIRFEGHLSVFDQRRDDSPCYNCLYPDMNEQDQTCSENGILAPVVGVIGCLQAIEAIKLICEIGDALVGKLLVFDALEMQCRSIRFKRDPECNTCGTTRK